MADSADQNPALAGMRAIRELHAGKAENMLMRNRDVIRAAGLFLGAIATYSTGAQSTLAPGLASPPEYRVVHGWPVLPEGEMLGSVAGIGVDSRGEVFVFHRAGRTWPKSDVLDLTPIPRPTIRDFRDCMSH